MRDTFLETILRMVKENFDMSKFDIYLHTQEKGNGILKTGIAFRNLKDEESYSPVIYLDEAYEDYASGNKMPYEIVNEIMGIYNKAMNHKFSTTDEYMNKDFILKNVFAQVINTNRNIGILSEIPHREFLNLSIIYKCLVSCNEQGMAAFIIRDIMLKELEITEDELYKAALVNTESIFPIEYQSIYDMTKELDPTLDPALMNNPMIVLTNEQRKWGATALLYPTYFAQIAKIVDDNLLIFPSSLHELIILPAGYMNIEEANAMLNSINPTIDPEDFLGNRIYYYDKDDNTLKLT